MLRIPNSSNVATRPGIDPRGGRRGARAHRQAKRWLFVASWLLGAPLCAAPPLEQLPDTAACVSETGTGGSCADGVALDAPRAPVVSPDGLNVYLATEGSDAIAIFDRDPATGELTQKAGTAGCASETGTGGECADGVALDGPYFVAVSPDGQSVYIATNVSDSIAVFARDLASGELEQLAGTDGCVSETGTSGSCADGKALDAVRSVVVSPDGRNVYGTSLTSSTVTVFDRDLGTGALTQQAGTDGCWSEGTGAICSDGEALSAAISVAVSPDGRNVYVASLVSDAVAVFDRDVSTGTLTQKAGTDGCVSETGTGGSCVDGVALDGARSVAVSPDGRSVYVVSFDSDAVAVFDRDLATGVLTQKTGTAGCVSETGTGGECAVGAPLDQVLSVVVSPDGQRFDVVSFTGGIASFDRQVSTGELSQHEGVAACASETGSGGSCRDGVALTAPAGLAVAPDGRHVYVASSQSDAVAALAAFPPVYDIDGDGDIEPLTDSLLLLRYAFGFTGATLVTGAVDLVNCTRCTAAVIESYIKALSGV